MDKLLNTTAAELLAVADATKTIAGAAPPLAETVTAPVAPLSVMFAPATRLVTPAFVKVTELPKATAPPPDIPVPAVTVTEELVKAELATLDKVPPRVKLPDVVTEPDKERPLTVPVPLTEVTVPVPGAAAAMV